MTVMPSLVAFVIGYTCSDPFCRSRVDTGIPQDPHAHCLYWENPHINYAQSQLGNPATGQTAFAAISSSFASWQQVANSCSSLQLTESPRSASRAVGYNTDGGANENLVLFRQTYCPEVVQSADACWDAGTCSNDHDCWIYQAGTIALTTTTYDTKSGILYDADIELNSAKFVFTTANAPACFPQAQNQNCVATDIQNTITHESGHLLGLDHNTSTTSTMFNSAPLGETSKRTIDPGSRQYICAVYPDGGAPKDCVIDPADTVLGAQAGCGATSSGQNGWWGAAALLATALALARAAARKGRR